MQAQKHSTLGTATATVADTTGAGVSDRQPLRQLTQQPLRRLHQPPLRLPRLPWEVLVIIIQYCPGKFIGICQAATAEAHRAINKLLDNAPIFVPDRMQVCQEILQHSVINTDMIMAISGSRYARARILTTGIYTATVSNTNESIWLENELELLSEYPLSTLEAPNGVLDILPEFKCGICAVSMHVADYMARGDYVNTYLHTLIYTRDYISVVTSSCDGTISAGAHHASLFIQGCRVGIADYDGGYIVAYSGDNILFYSGSTGVNIPQRITLGHNAAPATDAGIFSAARRALTDLLERVTFRPGVIAAIVAAITAIGYN